MTFSDIALIASLVILIVAIIDFRRGKTGLLHFRLTKEKSPQRYWATVVLYFNMAFGMFWLSGQVPSETVVAGCKPADQECTVTVTEAVLLEDNS
ncbi:MAG: hypothetical protein ABJP70_06230 [Erythrobacter sp.]